MTTYVIPLVKVRCAIGFPGCWHRVGDGHVLRHPGVIATATIKKRKVYRSGVGAVTGFGLGNGMRPEFGDGLYGSFWLDDLGCIDAPYLIAGGGMYAHGDEAFPMTVGRDYL